MTMLAHALDTKTMVAVAEGSIVPGLLMSAHDVPSADAMESVCLLVGSRDIVIVT